MLGPTYSLNTSTGEVMEMGWIAPDAYQFIQQQGEGLLTHTGVYDSWECADGVSGGYRAVGKVTVTNPDGTQEEEKTFCEVRSADGLVA